MNINKKKMSIILVILIILIIIGYIFFRNNKINEELNNNVLIINDEYINIDKNQISYKENVTIDELKNEVGITGNTDIYEIQEEFDGRKVLAVKAELKYQVAFAGMIKKSIPSLEEIEKIFEEKSPKYTGIWIEENSRSKILELFDSEKFNSKYVIDDDGYLKIEKKNNQNDLDKRVDKLINGKRQYILDISSICYIVDDVTGKILDYNFENIDKYQSYEYFEGDERMIIFITENSRNLLNDEEILEGVIRVMHI